MIGWSWGRWVEDWRHMAAEATARTVNPSGVRSAFTADGQGTEVTLL